MFRPEPRPRPRLSSLKFEGALLEAHTLSDNDCENGIIHHKNCFYDLNRFHQSRERKLGAIPKCVQLDYFSGMLHSSTEMKQISSDPTIWESISQRERDALSISEYMLVSTFNSILLEVILECLLVHEKDPEFTQISETGDSTVQPTSGSIVLLAGCVPRSFSSSVQDSLHHNYNIQQTLFEMPERPPASKLVTNIQKKIDALQEKSKSRLQQNSEDELSGMSGGMTERGIASLIEEVPPQISCHDTKDISRKRSQVVVIGDLPEREELPSWQKEVVLPVSYGVSLGMGLDILENNVIITGFVPVRDGVIGAAEASKRIDIGDTLLSVDGCSLAALDFDQIISLVRSITNSRNRSKVVLLFGIAEYINALPELQPARTRRLLKSDEEVNNPDPFSFLEGVKDYGGQVSTVELEQRRSQYYGFPGDLGFLVDKLELDRRMDILFEDSRRLRKLEVESKGFGFFDDNEEVPSLLNNSSNSGSVKITQASSAAYTELPLSEEVRSGGIDNIGKPWAGAPNMQPNLNPAWSPAASVKDNREIRVAKSVTEEPDFELGSGVKTDQNTEPIALLVREVVEVEEALREVELQLTHRSSLGSEVELSEKLIKMIQEKKTIHGGDGDEVAPVLQEVLGLMMQVDFSDQWFSPLDAWPPRHLTLTLASFIGMHIRDSVLEEPSVQIQLLLNNWLCLIRNRNHWVSSDSANQHPVSPSRRGPMLGVMSSLVDPRDILHRNLICDLTTLFFQLKVVGWKYLSFANKDMEEGSNQRGYFWSLKVRYESEVNEQNLWSEAEALEFITGYTEFIRINECLACAGFRHWNSVTTVLLDLATSVNVSEGGLCHDCCQLVSKILRSCGQLSHDTVFNRFYETREDEAFSIIPISHEDSVQLIGSLYNNVKHIDAYYALLVETGQLLWRFDSDLASSLFADVFPFLGPWHVWHIVNGTFGPLTFTSSDIGLRISVWFLDKYRSGVIIGFTENDAYGAHVIRFDERNDVEELDLACESFQVITRHRDEFTNVDAFGCVREHDAWWYPRILYHAYLARLLGTTRDGKMPQIDSSLMLEFVNLSLLLSTDIAEKMKQNEIMYNEEHTDASTVQLLRVMRHTAFCEGCVGEELKSQSRTHERLRFAKTIGRTAKEERLRNLIINAKNQTFFPGGSVESPLDFEAWAVRGFVHSDYQYPPPHPTEDRTRNWNRYLEEQWGHYKRFDKPTYRYCQVQGTHIDFQKLRNNLLQFDKMSDDTVAPLGGDVPGSDLLDLLGDAAVVSVGYRSAWGRCKDMMEIGASLQTAWAVVARSEPPLPKSALSPLQCLHAIDDAISMNSKNIQEDSFVHTTLSLGFLCLRYSYWDGVVAACEVVLTDGAIIQENNTCVWVYELLRLAALSVCDESCVCEMASQRLLKIFHLILRLSGAFSMNTSLLRRHPPRCLKKSNFNSVSNDHMLVVGIVIDIFKCSEITQLQSRNVPLIDTIVRSLVETLSLLNALDVLEYLGHYLDLNFGQALMKNAYRLQEIELQRISLAHETLSKVHADELSYPRRKEKVCNPFFEESWGCVIAEGDVCSLCSLSLTHNNSHISVFRCEHKFHSHCVLGQDCFLCHEVF